METDDSKLTLINIKKELRIARSEINNLRQQMRALKMTQQKSMDELNTKLFNWRCSNCLENQNRDDEEAASTSGEPSSQGIQLTPIGVLSTSFPKKRAVPRQPGVCPHSQGKLTLFNTVFTNPEHSLEGLAEFSHMWILFHFDRNASTHLHAKVSPPRLNGERTGVFATRSPHRPCPIGLSLVHIDSIEGATIFFSGVDMLDGTPVFDIKPYIPCYDDPRHQVDNIPEENRLMVQSDFKTPGSPGICPGHREAPDGEDSDEECAASSTIASQPIIVPAWVNPGGQLSVEFSSDADDQLVALNKEELKPVICSVLQEDPRSAYLKQRYSNQFYTFLIADLNVSCKFNDALHSVSVYRVTAATKICDCSDTKWQSSNSEQDS